MKKNVLVVVISLSLLLSACTFGNTPDSSASDFTPSVSVVEPSVESTPTVSEPVADPSPISKYDESTLLDIISRGFTGSFHCDSQGLDEEGNITFHIYEVVDNGDESHTATMDWITVNPITGDAFNFFGKEFNIDDYVESGDTYSNIEDFIASRNT